ncbi:hypothetical protein [Mucisphaera calidilacus]|uniref:Uncharacterized protein n=1 Tax=Mucisphaera calidilacus TaxID=2527982 RepID=A0A518BW23_9BACT|nr:hypothetical protein [Mucisphaera calidilacus]QDU71180.1 hypothetical protein Pan265_10290 [Mucisphaera calidilacus]
MSTMAMKLSERFFRLFDWRRNRNAAEETETVGGLPVATGRPQREGTLARLEEGYEQVLEVMASVKTHTRDQADRSERLLEAVREMPEAVAQLRHVAETQQKMAALLQKQITAHAEDRAILNGTLERLTTAFDNEQTGLDQIAKALSVRERTDAVLSDRLGGLGSTLGKLDETSQASTLMLRTLAERTKRADSQVRDLYDKGRRQMTLIAVASLLVALAAVGVAAYAVLRTLPAGSPGGAPEPMGGVMPAVPIVEEQPLNDEPAAGAALVLPAEAEAQPEESAATAPETEAVAPPAADADSDEMATGTDVVPETEPAAETAGETEVSEAVAGETVSVAIEEEKSSVSDETAPVVVE